MTTRGHTTPPKPDDVTEVIVHELLRCKRCGGRMRCIGRRKWKAKAWYRCRDCGAGHRVIFRVPSARAERDPMNEVKD